MTTFVWPVENISATIAGAATEATLLDVKTSVQLIDDTVLTNSHTSQKELATIQKGHVCTENSTTTPLAGGATFTGAWQDILDYNSVTIAVLSSHNSATDGLVIQWSANGSTVMDTDVFTIAANQPKTFTFGGFARYFRIVYTNGATLQTTFILQSIVRTSYGKHSSHRIKDAIVSDDDATLNKAVLTAKTPGGSFVNIDCTTGGNLKMSLEEIESSVNIAKETGGNLASIKTNTDKIPSQGQALMAASTPVAIASNQSAIPVLTNNALIPVAHDYIGVNVSGATADVYTYKTGGAGGTTVATLTINYTDATKVTISSIVRT